MKKFFCTLFLLLFNLIFTSCTFAEPYDIIIEKYDCGKILVKGYGKNDKDNFQYCSLKLYEQFYDLYKYFDHEDKQLIINDPILFYKIIKIGGPTLDHYMGMCLIYEDKEDYGHIRKRDVKYLDKFHKMDNELTQILGESLPKYI